MDTIDVKVEEGWQVGKPLVECLEHMLTNQVGCDVTFLVHTDDNRVKDIGAHKFMLNCRSPMFETKFSNTNSDSRNYMDIFDIGPDIVMKMLEYVYSDQVALNGENVLKLLHAGRKFLLQGLVDLCVDFLKSQIDNKNVCVILRDSFIHEEKDVREDCLRYIAAHTEKVLTDDGFLKLSHQPLLAILQEPLMPYGVENVLYMKSVAWAKQQGAETDEEIRKVLGECIKHFCFLSLTPKGFSGIARSSNVLTADEKSQILFSLIEPSVSTDGVRALGLSTKSRMCYFTAGGNAKVARFSGKSVEKLDLTVNKQVLLVGFSLFLGQKHADCDIDITFEAEQDFHRSVSITSNSGSGGAVPVLLPDALTLEENVSYLVTITLNCPYTSDHASCSSFGWAPLQCLQEEDVNIFIHSQQLSEYTLTCEEGDASADTRDTSNQSVTHNTLSSTSSSSDTSNRSITNTTYSSTSSTVELSSVRFGDYFTKFPIGAGDNNAKCTPKVPVLTGMFGQNTNTSSGSHTGFSSGFGGAVCSQTSSNTPHISTSSRYGLFSVPAGSTRARFGSAAPPPTGDYLTKLPFGSGDNDAKGITKVPVPTSLFGQNTNTSSDSPTGFGFCALKSAVSSQSSSLFGGTNTTNVVSSGSQTSSGKPPISLVSDSSVFAGILKATSSVSGRSLEKSTKCTKRSSQTKISQILFQKMF